MATIPASVKAQLDADWSGAGGAEPPYYVAEDYRTNPPLGGDSIWILDNTDTAPQVVNDTFVDEFHTIDIIVNATTADRLKEISDEVIRILNTTRILDMTYQRYKGRKNTSGVDVNNVFINQEIITYDMREQMKSSAASYGAGAGLQLDDLLMLGSAHAAWVPCMYIRHTHDGRAFRVSSATTFITNKDGTNASLRFDIPLPTVKGGLKLYITGSRVVINDADAAAYIDRTRIFGGTKTGATLLNSDTTDYNSQDQWDDTFGAVDCSPYDSVYLWLDAEVDAANELDIVGVALQCYYDT